MMNVSNIQFTDSYVILSDLIRHGCEFSSITMT